MAHLTAPPVRPHQVLLAMGLVLLVIAVLTSWTQGRAVAAGAPTLTVSPAPGGTPYKTGETLSLSVGPNSLFAPYARIEILECAAPKGVLPVDDTTCDGNTTQGNSVLVNGDGSFSDSAYTVYALPDRAIGDAPDSHPVCSATDECVLYIGEDQNDFTKPKIFSPTFTFAADSTAVTPTTAAGKAPAASSGSASAAVSLSGSSGTASSSSSPAGSTPPSPVSASASAVAPGTLAFTGAPEALPWLVGSGSLMILSGILARRRLTRKVVR